MLLKHLKSRDFLTKHYISRDFYGDSCPENIFSIFSKMVQVATYFPIRVYKGLKFFHSDFDGANSYATYRFFGSLLHFY